MDIYHLSGILPYLNHGVRLTHPRIPQTGPGTDTIFLSGHCFSVTLSDLWNAMALEMTVIFTLNTARTSQPARELRMEGVEDLLPFPTEIDTMIPDEVNLLLGVGWTEFAAPVAPWRRGATDG